MRIGPLRQHLLVALLLVVFAGGPVVDSGSPLTIGAFVIWLGALAAWVQFVQYPRERRLSSDTELPDRQRLSIQRRLTGVFFLIFAVGGFMVWRTFP